MKQSFKALLFGAVVALSACSQPAQKDNSAVPTVAIATLMTHPALDAVRKGIGDALVKDGLTPGKDVRIVDKNANGDVQLTSSIASELTASNPSLIVAITTPMAQAVRSKWNGPMVFAAVTDPVGAKVIPDMNGTGQVTGTSDAWPYRDQLALIHQIQPKVHVLGVLYNPGEAASQYGIVQIRKYAPEFGFVLKEFPVASTTEVSGAAELAIRNSDAIFLSSDNTVISGVSAAVQAAVKAKKALYVGDSGSVEKGGLAAVSVGYYDLGLKTGDMAARMLKGERNIPVYVATGSEVYINLKSAELMGIKVPDEVVHKATKSYDTISQ